MDNIFKKLRTTANSGKGLTIRELSKQINISSSHISEIENDIKRPSLNELKKYHDFFNIPIDALIGEKKNYQTEEILIKQTLDFLQKTSNGQAILSNLAEILYGINNDSFEKGALFKEETTDEWYKILYENIEDRAKIFTKSLLALRDPKYRKISYNEIIITLENENKSVKDEYSKKCKIKQQG